MLCFGSAFKDIYIHKNVGSFIKGSCCIKFKMMSLYFYGDFAKFFICAFLSMNTGQLLMFSLMLLFGVYVLW